MVSYYETICIKLGVDTAALNDKLRRTYLDAICGKLGIDVTTLPDGLRTTYLAAICQHMGIDADKLQDRLVRTYLEAILEKKGVDVKTLPDNLLSTYMEAIIECIGDGGNTGDGSGEPDTPVTPDPEPEPEPEVEKYSWAGVAASIKAGTYATDYAIGDTIPLDLGSEGTVNMEIVGFDADELADGSGKAAISWVAKELLKTAHRMNPALVTNDDGTYQEGTGAIGGWEKCEMRTYLNNTIVPMIPSDVQGMMKTVKKYSTGYDTTGTRINDMPSEDTIWIPCRGEIANRSDSYEQLSPRYNMTSRVKNIAGENTSYNWWIRSCTASASTYTYAGKTGTLGSRDLFSAIGIALGFCT